MDLIQLLQADGAWRRMMVVYNKPRHKWQAYVGKEQGSNATSNRLMGEGTSMSQAIADLDEAIRREYMEA